tara:strand:- start:1872 stop:2384 length:513 start_codon:yes stop_codon:yes gene_type:complete
MTLFSSGIAFTPSVSTFKYVGNIPPLGYFDPLKITYNADESKIKYLRESELQHGRIAMLSFVALATLDTLNDGLAINQLNNLNWEKQFPFWMAVFITEFGRMCVGWENPFSDIGSKFQLKSDYQPGNLLQLSDSSYTHEKMNKELSNGRLAMLACAGYIAQELVTQTPIL